MKYSFLFIVCLVLSSCLHPSLKKNKLNNTISTIHEKTLNQLDYIDWYHKDIWQDTLPGVSLNKAYNVIKDKIGDTVIIAVLDTEIDINHEDLAGSFWINSKEIPDNKIDDDNNGYVDDIHGWNFLGNTNGENIFFSNYEIIRIIRKYDTVFNNQKISEVPKEFKPKFELYQEALASKEEINGELNNSIASAKSLQTRYEKSLAFFDELYNSKEINNELILKYETTDSVSEVLKKDMLLFLTRGITKEMIQDYLQQQIGLKEKSLNTGYFDRKITGDTLDKLTDLNYGNPYISKNLKEFYHGTLVSGILTANRSNDIGIDGISDNFKIMSLAISANGDETDKDIVLAIRYAVNNGADIISMSSGKRISLHKKWVQDAVKYASDNNVLFVTSAGNDNLDLDHKDNNYFPNDNLDKYDKEISTSFIMVGASSYAVNNSLKYSFSNYGKKNVDIFAPGEGIKTTIPFNKYRLGYATSISTPIVAGVAGLVKSYYPNLSAMEIKKIIMDSGISYNIDVEVEQEDGSKKTIPFSELSKSGKVVNAYNAILMAEELSKSKEKTKF